MELRAFSILSSCVCRIGTIPFPLAWRLSRHLLEMSAEIALVAVTDLQTDIQKCEVALCHKLFRFLNTKLIDETVKVARLLLVDEGGERFAVGA